MKETLLAFVKEAMNRPKFPAPGAFNLQIVGQSTGGDVSLEFGTATYVDFSVRAPGFYQMCETAEDAVVLFLDTLKV